MTTKNRGLGRSLSMLLNNNSTQIVPTHAQAERTVLECALLQPGRYQPRGEIDESTLTELADSIKKQGLLQPIVVRAINPLEYEIIAGERRWRASQIAGLKEVPVIIKQVDDETAMALALIENLQREDLNAIDQARAMHRLTTEFELTHHQVAELLSKSRAGVSNAIRLLQLAPSVIKHIEHGDLDMGHARCLLILDADKQLEVAKLIIAQNLSVRETERLVTRVKEGRANTESQKIELAQNVTKEIENLGLRLKTKIKIKHHASGKGTLVISYNNEQKLETLLERLKQL